MAHLQLLNYTSIDGHDEFIKTVNTMEFSVSGPLRDGKIRPFVSEWRWYDIRIPEEKVPELVARLDARFADGGFNYMSKENLRSGIWFIQLAIKVARWFTPFKSVTPMKGVTGQNWKTWQYTFLIGMNKDPKQKVNDTDKKKEVL